MTVTPEIAIVVSPRPWAEELHRFVADHGGARVRARILDTREALSEPFHVLLADDTTSFLTPRLIDELHRLGRRVLGVHDDTDGWGRRRLTELGVDEMLPADAAPETFLQAIEVLTASATLDVDAELDRIVGGREGADDDADAEAGHAHAGSGAPNAATPPALRSRGLITAVLGPSGGPGATEVAIAMAAALAGRGERTVLVDADDVAASLAQRLGLPQHPNIRSAVDVSNQRSGTVADTLQPVSPAGFHLLAGIANPGDWEDLRPGECTDVLAELARTSQHVVANVGHRLEDLAGFGGHGRHATSRAVLAMADRIVVVVAPTPVGLARGLDLLADISAMTSAPVAVLFNRTLPGRFAHAELEGELRRSYSPAHLDVLPEDRRVTAAAWAGHVVASGPFAKAVTRFVGVALPRVAAVGAGATAATAASAGTWAATRAEVGTP